MAASANDWIHNLSMTGLEWFYAFRPEARPTAPKPVVPAPGGGGPAAVFDVRNPYFGLLVVAGVVAVVGLLIWLVLR